MQGMQGMQGYGMMPGGAPQMSGQQMMNPMMGQPKMGGMPMMGGYPNAQMQMGQPMPKQPGFVGMGGPAASSPGSAFSFVGGGAAPTTNGNSTQPKDSLDPFGA